NVAQFTGQSPTLSLYTAGQPVVLRLQRGGSYVTPLQPGTYVLAVTWTAGKTAETYVVDITTPQHENATPLTSGPAPALSLHLVSDTPPVVPPVTPPVTPPAPPGPVIVTPPAPTGIPNPTAPPAPPSPTLTPPAPPG